MEKMGPSSQKMEKTSPSSPKMEKTSLDLIADKESQFGEERKKFGWQLTSKYQGNMDDFTFPTLHAGAFPHHLGLGGSAPPPWFLAAAGGEEDEDEEKMDMLWEDFNEELTSAPPLCPLSPLINKGGLAMKEEEAWLEDELIVVDLEKHAKHLPSQDGRVVRRRRWSMRLMLRLLKKLFMVKKTRDPRTAPI
ncbi:hypothetical protein BAE44_0017770 [Dichanthelium oligosanthes]|uniref:Uncharacterized protein n=1 Tax=Dichanthelium oligosanthes TaxID=888268 RepID=A0A1E5V7W6_9POAL|nr:hypothetical protein BAE44_0017770 [Dichanthelium oligosanthes]